MQVAANRMSWPAPVHISHSLRLVEVKAGTAIALEAAEMTDLEKCCLNNSLRILVETLARN